MEETLSFKDYYAILGVSPGASREEIRTAFRRLARQTHPDVSGDPSSYGRFVLIREGYDVLTDSAKRTQYDRTWRVYAAMAGSPKGGDEYVDEIIREFFTRETDEYRDEWEYFVRSPDDYLNLFQSSVRMALGALAAVGAGMLVPLAVFAGTALFVAFFFAVVAVVTGALVTNSFSSVAGIIMALMIYRRIRKRFEAARLALVRRLGRTVVRPLRGIPQSVGKWVLYGNYLAVLIFLVAFGCASVAYARGALMAGGAASGAVLLRSLLVLLIALAHVIVFSSSIVLIFEVIREALDVYPPIRYTRIKIRRQSQIQYEKQA